MVLNSIMVTRVDDKINLNFNLQVTLTPVQDIWIIKNLPKILKKSFVTFLNKTTASLSMRRLFAK